MAIPESVEHKKIEVTCDICPIKDCETLPDDARCPDDICAPDCPQCLNEKWAKWILAQGIEYSDSWSTAVIIPYEEFESLKKMAGQK